MVQKGIKMFLLRVERFGSLCVVIRLPFHRCCKDSNEMGKKALGVRWRETDEWMSTRWRCGQAGDATPRELPTSFTPDSDDEAGQMIAVSRQCRQTHMNTHKCINTHKLRVRQSQLSTSVPPQDTDVLPSPLVSAHTHTHIHTKLPAKYMYLLAHTQPLSQLHSTITIVFWGGIVKKS